MPLELIRIPRSGKMRHKDIQDEVRKALNDLGDKSIKTLQDDVKEWNEKPEFTKKVSVVSKKWALSVKTSKSRKIGKIFDWVDKGTGSRGGHKDYVIKPKRKNGMLRFSWPNNPKSLPNPAIPGFPQTDPVRGVRRKEVIHPGIYPRNFTKTLFDALKDRTKPGGFRSVVEAAIKRAIYRRK